MNVLPGDMADHISQITKRAAYASIASCSALRFYFSEIGIKVILRI